MDIERIYIIISAVTVLCALGAPALTAIINNHHQLKLRQMELEHSAKVTSAHHHRDIVESYLKVAGAVSYDYNVKSAAEYGKYYALAFAHFPCECHEQMKKLNSAIRYDNYNEARAEYEKLAAIVRSHIPE